MSDFNAVERLKEMTSAHIASLRAAGQEDAAKEFEQAAEQKLAQVPDILENEAQLIAWVTAQYDQHDAAVVEEEEHTRRLRLLHQMVEPYGNIGSAIEALDLDHIVSALDFDDSACQLWSTPSFTRAS